MKKILSIVLVCILVLSLFTLTGCMKKDDIFPNENDTPVINPNINNSSNNTNDNENENNNQKEENNNNNQSELKTTIALEPLQTQHYYLKLLTDAESNSGEIISNATMEITVDGNNFATDIKEAGYGMIVKGDTMYSIMHDVKQYVQMQSQETIKQELLNTFTTEEYINEFAQSGNREFKGNNYYFEQFVNDKETTTLYFDNDTLKYIQTTYSDGSEATVIEIIEISNKTKYELFEIPNDYTSFEF